MEGSRMHLDAETKAFEQPEHHRDELRLWLRLLTCSTLIETEVRKRLRERFDVTLPRCRDDSVGAIEADDGLERQPDRTGGPPR